jgi:hypothetical protein
LASGFISVSWSETEMTVRHILDTYLVGTESDMTVRYIFNTSGQYVAFITGGNLFTPDGEWIGVIANGNEVYNTNGLYIGLVLDDDRIIRDKRDTTPKWVPRPRCPRRPPIPMEPLRRLRMPEVPYPYEDVFETTRGTVTRLVPLYPLKDYNYLLGALIYAADETFLGLVSKNSFDPNSISNSLGAYGSWFSQTSIFNEFGPYGGEFSPMSPFNDFSPTPPRLERDGYVLGYLTTNKAIPNRIDTNELIAWLNT